MVVQLVVCVAVLISIKVAEVANMADLRKRTTVSFVEGVVVRSSSLASLSKITYLIDKSKSNTYRTDECGIREDQGLILRHLRQYALFLLRSGSF